MKKILSILLVICMVTAICAGSVAYAESASSDRVLRMTAIMTSEWFDPLSYGNGDKAVYHALFDTLTRFDNDGNIIPGLAESWEKEGLELTAHLREAYFTNGNRVTADDVVFSFNRILEDPQLMYNMTMWCSGIEKIDDSTVKFTLANNYCKYENFLAELLYVVDASEYDPEADFSKVAPVGSGPYTLVNQDESRNVFLTANDNYWKGAPAIKNVEIVASMDDATEIIALQTGELDVATQLGIAGYNQVNSMDGLAGVSFNGWQCTGLMIPHGDDAFRQAIFHAIDRQTVIDICIDGNGVPATNLFAKKISDPYTDVVPLNGYDLDLAMECIANTTMDLSQTFAIEVFDADGAAAAQCIQADLSVIGINCEVVEEDINTWVDNLIAGNIQMSVAAMCTDMVGTEDMISMFDPEAGYPFDLSDETMEKVKTVPYIQDDAERYEKMVDLISVLYTECPWVPLFDGPMYYGYNADVQGLIDCSAATCVFYVGDLSFAE